MKTITLNCAKCSKEFIKPLGEYNRQLRKGRDSNRFYCSSSCGNWTTALIIAVKYTEIERSCLYCNKIFTVEVKEIESDSGKKHCSLSCASLNSITEKRLAGNRKGALNGLNLLSSSIKSKALLNRESWKYAAIKEVLDKHNIEYCFEFPIGGYFFDLALTDRKVIIEFDGLYHASRSKEDAEKARAAEEQGWAVFREKTPNNTVLDVKHIVNYL